MNWVIVSSMGKFGGVVACLAAIAVAPLPAQGDTADPQVRESEFELPAAEAWQQEGFRIQLRFGTESLSTLGVGPFGGGWAIGVEPGVRLSRFWSLSASLRYSVLNEDIEGLRWSTTADLTFHPWGGIFLATGLGYGGLIASGWESDDWNRCEGHAIVALGRVGWLFSLGELFSTGPVVQFDAQATKCGNRSDEGDFDDFDGPIEEPRPASRGRRSVWWSHRTLNLSWSVAWR